MNYPPNDRHKSPEVGRAITPSASLLHRRNPTRKMNSYNPRRRVAPYIGALVGMMAGQVSASTIAYFGFEEGTNGTLVNPTGSSGATGSAVVPGGGDGSNGMVAWSTAASPTYTTTSVAPAPYANSVAMAFGGGRDLYQQTPASSTLSTTAFTNITVEAFVNFNSLSGWQTFVGRDDDANPGSGIGPASLFYLAKSGADNGFRVELITAENANVSVNSTVVPLLNTWYHVAAVGDSVAGTLSLYVDGVLAGSTTGFNGLLVPSAPTSWTLGRGQFNGNPGDTINGILDEVRISDSALSPSEFLNVVPEPSVALLGALGALGMMKRRRNS